MTSATMKARIVRIKYEEGKTGLFYAISPDLKGLLVAKTTIDDLRAAIPNAIRALYAACGVNVVVFPAEDSDPEYYPWAAIPAELAHKVLEKQERELADA